jgi:hypothetical protein
MIVVARDASQPPDLRGCIAWATSPDLVHWTPGPPIFSPGAFHTVETPSLFEHDGRWYLLYMTHPAWGPPVMVSDPYQEAGDFQAVSETGPAGPFRRPPDEIVAAARGHLRMAACRTVEAPDGGRLLYGWLSLDAAEGDARPPLARRKVMPPPRRVAFGPDGAMHVVFNPDIERTCGPAHRAGAPIPVDDVGRWSVDATGARATSFTGRTLARVPSTFRNGILRVTIDRMHGERAGVAIRAEADAAPGIEIVVDWRHGRVEFGASGMAGFIDARRLPLSDRVELGVLAIGPSIEVYANNRLAIHQVRHAETGNGVALLAERAEVRFGAVETRDMPP